MRLIDVDALFEELNDKDIPWNRRINDIIMAQPITYDIENVIEQLEEYREEFMQYIYTELESDLDNYRANRIIDKFDEIFRIVEMEWK